MTLALATTVKNAALDVVEDTIGTSPVLKLRTGAPPGIGAADSGTVLATIACPADWMNAASGGSKTLLGTWQDASADASGDAGHFRLYKSNGTTVQMEGTVVAEGSAGDLGLTVNGTPSVTIAATDVVAVTSFTLAV